GESITEVQIGRWLKAEGEWADKDQPLVEIESDKATVELPAPEAGKVTKVLKRQGETAAPGEVIGYLEASNLPLPPGEGRGEGESRAQTPSPSPLPKGEGSKPDPRVMPAAERVLAARGLDARDVAASGPGGRLLKEDVQRHVAKANEGAARPASARIDLPAPLATPLPAAAGDEEIVPMSPLRRRVAERLVEAQQTAALLTTFNEVDMSAVMALRQQHRESFQQKHGVKLGFMSFFVKAVIESLKQTPQINAEIRGTDVVYHNYFDIGIAIGGGKGLVVPVLRGADRMSFAEIEAAIEDFGRRARDNKIKIEELQGGTFTISNGGIYGSLLSTPIVNPPQSGILGMHAIQERPVAREGQVVIRPMMYLALTYDHRIVDGREAVLFLRHIKELTEEPSRMLLEI
ncbi:MAG TPA: 2-oxoglutarate dehydrogenase complex dihydrolipoyllysine-residue succinyltransferase, partial [Pirellulales bacterium]|nr:2-oxoglutarate dehydrogenase complex dihydrolipoyllysine-residue succinyltransferase [Pirellulales bacterium]